MHSFEPEREERERGGGGGGGYFLVANVPAIRDVYHVGGYASTTACPAATLRQKLHIRGRYHGGRRPSSYDSFHSPTVIPPSALDKPSIMKRYYRQRTTRWGVTARSPTIVTLHDTRFVECGMTVGLWRLSSLDGRRLSWYRPQICSPIQPQCSDTRSTSSSSDPATPDHWHGSHQGPVSWRPTTVKWRHFSQSNRHSTIGKRQTEYREVLPSSANVLSHLTSSFTDNGNASWYSVCRVPMVEWRLDCEVYRHLTVVGLHDTGPRVSISFPHRSMVNSIKES